jgi:hypothetical protein
MNVNMSIHRETGNMWHSSDSGHLGFEFLDCLSCQFISWLLVYAYFFRDTENSGDMQAFAAKHGPEVIQAMEPGVGVPLHIRGGCGPSSATSGLNQHNMSIVQIQNSFKRRYIHFILCNRLIEVVDHSMIPDYATFFEKNENLKGRCISRLSITTNLRSNWLIWLKIAWDLNAFQPFSDI